jgi:hypothetical protein
MPLIGRGSKRFTETPPVLSSLTTRTVAVTFAKADLFEFTGIAACTSGSVPCLYRSGTLRASLRE